MIDCVQRSNLGHLIQSTMIHFVIQQTTPAIGLLFHSLDRLYLLSTSRTVVSCISLSAFLTFITIFHLDIAT